MKYKLRLLLALMLLAGVVEAQKSKKKGFTPGQIKPALFGIAFNLTDFNAPKNFGSNSNGSTLPIADMSAGASISYWRGITPFIDFSARLNGIFHDYSSNFRGLPGKTEVGLELQPSISIRPLKDENLFSPFLTAGLGLGVYTGTIGGFVPLGAGVQLNAGSTTYLFLEAQYNWSISPTVLGNNLFYSLGFAQNIGGNTTPAPKVSLPVVPATPVVADRDGDGVPDETDNCPDVKGVTALKGCPDADGDGITDKDDKCPTVKGLLKYNGCPVPDTDKDGINDEDDKCPDLAGVARYNGCPVPDTDKDGVNDEEDKCPSQAGVISNAGCPEIAQATIQKVNKAAKEIFFAKGSTKLLPTSFKALNAVAAIMQEDASYKVDVEGHTDNQGDALKNKALSEARAVAVKTYLVKKGISEDRISAAGFGDEAPLADNGTEAGRAKNRRVELKVRNY